MPPPSPPNDEYEVFKGSLLPAGMRPLVLIAWQVLAGSGGDSEYRRMQYFVVVPGSEVVAKEMGMPVGELEGHGVLPVMSIEAMRKFALSRAQRHLDELAAQQFSETHAPRTFYQPVALEPAHAHEVQAFGLAEEYGHAWSFIRDHTLGENLRSRMGMILKLRRLDYGFHDAPPIPGRMR